MGWELSWVGYSGGGEKLDEGEGVWVMIFAFWQGRGSC